MFRWTTILMATALFALPFSANAEQAEFDMEYIETMDDPDSDVVFHYGPTDVDGYCEAIFEYPNYQEDGGDYTEGPAWAYMAAKLPPDEDCTWISDHALPGFVFLHGFGKKESNGTGGARGSLSAARLIAELTGALVISISSPGQGYKCSVSPDSDEPECDLTNDTEQISHGEPMSAAEKRDIYDESGDVCGTQGEICPKYNFLYSYAHSAMRAVTVALVAFGDDGHDTVDGWINGHVVLGGFSAGGATTLLVNGVDDRIDGALSLEATGAFNDTFIQSGNWSSYKSTGDLGTPSATINCATTSDPDEIALCDTSEWLDPINYTPQNPVLVMTGAQDGIFSVRSFARTRSAFLSSAPNEKIYTYLVPDMDHKWYIAKFWVETFPCEYAPTGEPKLEAYWQPIQPHTFPDMIDTIKAFFIKAVNNDLGDFGDRDPTTTITITGSLIKTYTTKIEVTNSNHFLQADEGTAQIGYTGTKFFHVYPSMDGSYVDRCDIPAVNSVGGCPAGVTTTGSCPAGKTCWTYPVLYWSFGQPPYFGSYGQVNYAQADYGPDDIDLKWSLTGKIVSAGTGGWTVLTFPQDFRCPEVPKFEGECKCDMTPLLEGEEEEEQEFEDAFLGNL